VRLQCGKKSVQAYGKSIVDNAFILQCLDLVPPPIALLVNLFLFSPYERPFVDVGVDFDITIIGQLEGVLRVWLVVDACGKRRELVMRVTYPLAVVDHHFDIRTTNNES
jgi:hypothetical protein